MKRNLMPLLGVAFVAAVVATGIFYGLLIPRLRTTAAAESVPKAAPVKKAEPGPTAAIPAGWRAVSVHPAESSGVVMMLKAGSRVDVQVIESRPGPSVRRMMEDVEVLGVQAGETARPVVTLLVRPADADRLSLADAAAQLRVLARNPGDRSVEPVAP